MESRRALADYSLHDLPNLVVAIIEDKLKLYAAVLRVRDLYFLPSTTPIADAIPEKYIGENGNIKKEYLAAQGCYAISDTNPLIRKLESIYKAETHPDSLGRVRAKSSPQTRTANANSYPTLRSFFAGNFRWR